MPRRRADNDARTSSVRQVESGTRARVTLKDIAAAVGVTSAAVSYALRNHPGISKALKEKIQATAEQMGYRPDPMLAALARYRRSQGTVPIQAELAWVNCWPDPKQLHAFKEFELYWQGARDEAERAGYRLEEFALGGELKPRRLESILRARNIQGILIAPQAYQVHPDWGNFPWDDFCVARFGYSADTPRAHVVTSDQLNSGVVACQRIRELGYQRIGLVVSIRSHTRFASGYLYGQMGANCLGQIPPLILTEKDANEDCRNVRAWLDAHRPDAVFTDVAALRGYLDRLEFRVPQDIGLAAFSVLDGNASAGIYQNSEQVGRAALQLLISLITHQERGIPKVCRELLVEGTWVDGKTMPRR